MWCAVGKTRNIYIYIYIYICIVCMQDHVHYVYHVSVDSNPTPAKRIHSIVGMQTCFPVSMHNIKIYNLNLCSGYLISV